MRTYLQVAVSVELTFAGRHTLKPAVTDIFVVDTPTVLKPSTTRSTTTDSAGFLKRATFGTRHRVRHR